MDLIPDLVQQPITDYIGGEARDKVDIIESTMFSILAGEEYCYVAFNLHDGTIAKPDSACHTGVKVIECFMCAGHVVRCTCVEDPPVWVVVSGRVEDGEDGLLHQLDGPHRSWQRDVA
jgi:hypothetical protein